MPASLRMSRSESRAAAHKSFTPSSFKERSKKMAELSFRKKQLKKSIENITRHLESEDSEALVTRLRALESEKQAVDRQLAVSKTGIDNLNKSSLKPLCRQFCELLKTSDAPEVKAYLSHAVKEVLIGNDDVKITLNIA